MPRLLLLRHAKAERARQGEKDHERPLAGRGREESAEIGRMLAAHGEKPDRVLCSTSLRTRQTWDVASAALANTSAPRLLRSIYEAPDGDYIAILRHEAGKARALLLVGHNPAIHVTALRLADNLAGTDGSALANGFPTAGVAVFELDGGWGELATGTARLTAFLRVGEAEDGLAGLP